MKKAKEMKLSELSFREYIALKIYPTLVAKAHNSANDLTWQAFNYADAFLKRAGREHDKVAEIKRECEKLEAQVAMLLNMHPTDNFSPKVALEQIWEFLDVKDQTNAMSKLRKMKDAIDLVVSWPSDMSGALREAAYGAKI